MKRTHIHQAQRTNTVPFRGPVAKKQNPAAHGNIMEVQVCRCGAIRCSNINGAHSERGRWQLAPEEVAS